MNTPKDNGRICILGAGPTGLGAASRLTELGHTNFCVYDRNDYVGGLAASFFDAKGFTWDMAVHVLHSHYHYVDRLLERALPDGYYTHERRSWVRMHQTYIPYPFQYNIRHLPPAALQDCIEGLQALPGDGDRAPGNFAEWVEAGFGSGIARHFMLPYNRKLWTVDPKEMAYQWIGDRVPTVDVERVLRNIEQQKDDVSWGPNFSFLFPKEGGTGAIWRGVAAMLPQENLRLSHDVVEIDSRAKRVRFANGETDTYDHLVSTIPIPELVKLTKWDALEKRAGQLRNSHVYVICVGPNHPIPETLAEKTWLYCPEETTAFYRVTPFSIFSGANVPDPEQYCSFMCEVGVPGGEERDVEELTRLTLKGLVDAGILDSVAEDTHTHVLDAPYGYPIPTRDRDAILADVLPAFESRNIYSRGRFGGWKYEAANMDHSVMQGVEAVDRILNDTPERTLPNPAAVNAAGKQ